MKKCTWLGQLVERSTGPCFNTQTRRISPVVHRSPSCVWRLVIVLSPPCSIISKIVFVTHPSRRRTEIFRGGIKAQVLEQTCEIGKISRNVTPSKDTDRHHYHIILISFEFTYELFSPLKQLGITPWEIYAFVILRRLGYLIWFYNSQISVYYVGNKLFVFLCVRKY